MFKKQRYNSFLNHGIQIFLTAFLILVQFIFIPQTEIENAQAQSPTGLACTYETKYTPSPSGGSTGGISSNATYFRKVNSWSLVKNPIFDSSNNNAIGVKGKVNIILAPGNTSQYNSSCNGVRADIYISSSVAGVDYMASGSGNIVNVPVTAKVESTGTTLELSFDIPDFSQNIVDHTLSADLTNLKKRETQSTDYFISVVLVEDTVKKALDQIPASTIPLIGCVEKTKICTSKTADTSTGVVSDDKLAIELSKIKLALRIAQGSNPDIIPKDRRGKPQQNFFRVYLGQEFDFGAQVLPVSPKDKNLYIKDSNGQSSKIILPDPKFSLKPVLGIAAGVFNEKMLWNDPKNTNNIGCIRNTQSTNGGIGTNAVLDYNWCNLRPVDVVKGGVNIKMDGSEQVNIGIKMNASSLASLLPTIELVKTSECDQKTKICPEPQTKSNNLNVAPSLVLDPATWQDTTLVGVTQGVGVTAIWAGIRGLAQWMNGLPISFSPNQKIYVVVYEDKATWEANKDQDTPSWVPEPTDVVGSAEAKEGGVGQSLYAFIVRVISVVITWLQTIIYAAFAYILVPVLNALLKVRPYKDTFVNIIYPGWLILRNLANIFFIVSLLVVGLKILFQQSAASTAKNFILRLVLMALLVNFSLVISQGIVGIADTVQSQFLPADSKIIEALGSKLMVEPLKNFRDQVAGANDTFSTDDAEGSIADTVKPLVLLMLSLASFFSFAALAAFLLVRLVVLWVLYMTSPVAYVGYVMEETQTYAKQWWKEFLKYVIMTPVLVFFLNIAALMATLFSGQDNSIFEFSEGIAGDIVAATMTIISHFIVLFFIYVGMKFALSSGTIGAKTIVDYAKKGFDTFTSKPAKWAAGQAKEAAQTQWDRRFKGGMLDPKAHIGAFKEQVDKTTKTKMEKRLGGKANKLTPEGLYSNPKRALKYVLGGASAGTEGFQNEINAKRDEAAILTEAERRDLTTNAALNTVSLNTARRQMEAMEDGKLENSMAQEKIATELDNEIRRLGDAKRDEVAELTRRGRTTEAGILARDYDARIADLTAVKTDIDNAILASTDGNIVLDAETKDKVSVVFDADDVKAELKDEITDLESKANALTNDAERRNKYGYGVAGTNGAREIDFNRQMQLKNEAEKLEEQMNDHAMPVSLGARNARLTRESEAAKKIAHLEGEELRYAFKKAMADNNMDLAAAIAKKAAQEGDADMLLKEHGFKNNIEDFHKFINQKFASFGPSVRAQIGSEISALADKNGNAAIGKAYRVNNSGQLVGRSMQEQAKKVNTSIAKSPPEDVFKKKPTEISRQIGSNQHELYEGIVTNLNTMNKEKLKNMVRRMPAKTAKFILNASNKNLLSLDVKLALEKTANKS